MVQAWRTHVPSMVTETSVSADVLKWLPRRSLSSAGQLSSAIWRGRPSPSACLHGILEGIRAVTFTRVRPSMQVTPGPGAKAQNPTQSPNPIHSNDRVFDSVEVVVFRTLQSSSCCFPCSHLPPVALGCSLWRLLFS